MTHSSIPQDALEILIPHRAPTELVARTLLVSFRRLAASGINDAHAVNILMGDFGMAYHRPLLFLRVLVAELSRIAQRPIHVAPCCCPRMTHGENSLLIAIQMAREEPDRARATLARLTASLDCLPALSIAQALADALDDIGRPLITDVSRDCLN